MHEIEPGDRVYSWDRFNSKPMRTPQGVVREILTEGGEVTDVKVEWFSNIPEIELILYAYFEGNYEEQRGIWFLGDE